MHVYVHIVPTICSDDTVVAPQATFSADLSVQIYFEQQRAKQQQKIYGGIVLRVDAASLKGQFLKNEATIINNGGHRFSHEVRVAEKPYGWICPASCEKSVDVGKDGFIKLSDGDRLLMMAFAKASKLFITG